MKLNESQIRCMDCLKTGFFLHSNETIRFMTLTTADGMKSSLMSCFSELKKRIMRMTPLKMIDGGYIDGNCLNDFYSELSLDDFLRFCYLAVRTSEGVCGVLHVLFVGDFIPYRWLSDTWYSISGTAKVVDISEVKDVSKTVNYVAMQQKVLGYVSGQTKHIRFSYSKGWVFDGYSRIYKDFMSAYWHRELCRINSVKGFVKFPFNLYQEIFLRLTYEEKKSFYNKRWCDWLELIGPYLS